MGAGALDGRALSAQFGWKGPGQRQILAGQRETSDTGLIGKERGVLEQGFAAHDAVGVGRCEARLGVAERGDAAVGKDGYPLAEAVDDDANGVPVGGPGERTFVVTGTAVNSEQVYPGVD
jgi:hypothetical protein